MTSKSFIWETRDVPLDDCAMQRHARELAVSMTLTSFARLSADRRAAARLEDILKSVRDMADETAALTSAMEWLADNGKLVRAYAARRTVPSRPLPAAGGAPRIQMLMRELIAHSDASVSAERLEGAIAAFDEVRALTMDELWSAPAALRAELLRAFLRVARRALASQREWLAAECWTGEGARPERIPRAPGPAFLERAFQLMHDEDMPDARAALETRVAQLDMDARTLITAEHERQAIDKLWLSNILATLRMLDALRWDESFKRISRTERTLSLDPGGAYPHMDDASRAEIRRQVARLARGSGMGETTIARQAILAAKEASGRQRQVCWWLFDDDGIRALTARLGSRRPAPAVTPDPRGHAYLMSVLVLTAAVLLIYLAFDPGAWAVLLAFPILWGVGALLANTAATRTRPRTLLKLEFEQLPDDVRTLVVMPALFSDAGRAVDLAGQIETLGAVETDPNIEYLLLGDLSDASGEHRADDADVLSAVRTAIDAANRRAGTHKYHVLWRERRYAPTEGKYMARERKRGALEALNDLLLGYGDEFAEREAASRLVGRFSMVVTVDAGTRMIPGTIHRLVGAAAHPINRLCRENGRRKGYAVLQPRMELPADAITNRFVQLFGGEGGVDAYPTCVSDVYQDLSGQGIFGGKGVYDVAAFHGALVGKLPDGAILSHDMIEGILAGAGFLGDITLYDGYPRTASAYLKRLHRWTRGDWQLIPILARARSLRLSALDVYKIIDNLRRSLVPACQMALMVLGFVARRPSAVAVALLPLIAPMLLSPLRLRGRDFVRLALRLALLPFDAAALLDAVARTLYRVGISGRRLLEWVTADDVDRQKSGMSRWPGWAASVLVAPALLTPAWIAPTAALIFLWCACPAWVRTLEKPSGDRPRLTDAQRALNMQLAERTWQFFERNVPECGLPPDNVQFEPPVGLARRTSPTNIGLYLIGCLAARDMGIIGADEAFRRMEAVVSTVEGMDKWCGHLYNWYDIDGARPLCPRYVSSVDSGNLAACLLTCASALGEGSALARRMERLAADMDFLALFDSGRRLFVIGIDVESGRISASHYDLLASESRILSYVAMMLKQIPVAHWARLSRAQVAVGASQALLSWSGTMFEYLMPELFMPTVPGTLLRKTRDTVIAAQKKARPRVNGELLPWGASESGYYAFDLKLNYQYRAFGLPALSLRGDKAERVIAPYASLLALCADPDAVTENLRRMQALGWQSDQGLYEAVDCAPERLPVGAGMKVIYSHMAHHQGMILAAQANALCDQSIQKYFMRRPEARALALLLQEKPSTRIHFRRQEPPIDTMARISPPARLGRAAHPEWDAPDSHLIFGGSATLFLTATGAGFMRRDGVLVGRRSLSARDAQGFYTHLRDVTGGAHCLLSGQRAQTPHINQRAHFDAGYAEWTTRSRAFDAKLTVCLSPEDGAMIRRVTLSNRSASSLQLELTDVFPVALAAEVDYAAHPAFQNLFIESARPRHNALLFRRRARQVGELHPTLLHVASGAQPDALSWESDLNALVGRTGDISKPGGIASELGGALGQVLNPCSALRVRMTLAAGESATVCFAIGLIEHEDAGRFLEQHSTIETSLRALELSGTQARAMLRFLGLSPRAHHALQRSAALLCYTQPHRTDAQTPPDHDLTQRDLWALGLSGELPVIVASAASKDHLTMVREVMRMHEFYRSMGLWCDLALINEYGNDYDQPVRDGLTAMLASSHLCGLIAQPGGAHLIEGASLSARQREALLSVASIRIIGGCGGMIEQLKCQLPEPHAARTPWSRLPGGRRLSGFSHGFLPDGAYRIECSGQSAPPAPWMNLFANPDFGAMISERGGGFTFYKNSRSGRLTPFENDPLREGFSEIIYLADLSRGARAPLTPVPDGSNYACTATHAPGLSTFTGEADRVAWTMHVFVDAHWPVKCQAVELVNGGPQTKTLTLIATVDWLMGVSREDVRFTVSGHSDSLLWAVGGIGATGFMAMPGAGARPASEPIDGRDALMCDITLEPGEVRSVPVVIGCAHGLGAARNLVADWLAQGDWRARMELVCAQWHERLSRIEVDVPDERMNHLINRWLPYQALAGRIWGRAGFYQAGGAYGFRDQLQDTLALIDIEPQIVRAHLLVCARRQFEDGDVMHWWHPDRTGVRTRISDDLLFLPFVTAIYVEETGDRSVLYEITPYLKNVPIPDGQDDVYGEPPISDLSETLHEHCMRAIHRALRLGQHGLSLMGSGDWNDGMNRIGHQGLGESVWLSEFTAVTLRKYAALCDEDTAHMLRERADALAAAVEAHGWDGEWYLRAYTDSGTPIGSHTTEGGCRIDAIAQSWAVMAGLDAGRVRSAMEQVRAQLIDREHGVIKLLTPPFEGDELDPGYIKSYPPGVRENGGQYTHAACWVVMALAQLGMADAAWDAFQLIMPYAHADTPERTARYRVEPYVVAADVYGEPPHAGRGGWTWYTGSAAWMVRVAHRHLMGYKRRGDRVLLSALLPAGWERVSVRVRAGASLYTLIAERGCPDATLDGVPLEGEWVRLIDDGRDHIALFPPRNRPNGQETPPTGAEHQAAANGALDETAQIEMV